jgi:hypothetical protein
MCVVGVEVLGPKGPAGRYGGVDMLTWARDQLRVADEIMDNPGGGLLFATQTIGQVKAGLAEADPDRWQAVVSLLEGSEAHAVRREFTPARKLLAEARAKLG